jgi:hypothetical protein
MGSSMTIDAGNVARRHYGEFGSDSVASGKPKRLSSASDDHHIPDAEIAPAWMPAQCQTS